MKVCVLGLGYVGSTTAVCLAELGHTVVGADADVATLAAFAAGIPKVAEPGFAALAAQALGSGRLRLTVDTVAAVAASDLTLVCVGTPSAEDGALDTEALERAATDIGDGLAEEHAAEGGNIRHTVVFRSTMLPGTCARLLVPRLEKSSGLVAGVGFGVAVHPEFLREGSSVADFRSPSRLVVGGFDAQSAEAVMALYPGTTAPVLCVSPATAEMSKYADNAFHALKVAFANELGSVARRLLVDTDELVEVFLADRALNLSEAYLRPGFAFGGSCLPKDLRALLHDAEQANITLPLLEHVLPANEAHLDRTVDDVAARGHRRVGVVGLAFKAGTSDLRGSPLLELCGRLRTRGFDVRAWDPAVPPDSAGTMAEVVVGSLDDLLAHADTLVVARRDDAVLAALSAAHHLPALVDLVGLPDALTRAGGDGRGELVG
ncbi:nucleotide sugar dehydrogenase [Actinomycetospora termitidis]|uniref:UDP-glucose 6-dehydrogenase n=1 Tax=Actinomycetospora termitidis TaxID=3053470 RepID=A0ABT7MGN0_9PSEU|nr:nucleotide sugar dehydrogenase [Actinomycetospora sp. Odt1-22]MDL5159002.1 nucleotide sugar dehydrogenase [Actinomycetospora sp. Odt1-22]